MTSKKSESFLPPDSVDYGNPTNNITLTKTESSTMNSRPSNSEYARSKDTLIFGGSGSGKTRFFVKPNLMPWKGEIYGKK